MINVIIYKVTNLINNKVYIGQTTKTLKHRQDQHRRETESIRKNSYFHNAIAKYGFENFLFEVIDCADSIEELNNKEVYWINYYNSTNKEIGYNLDSGGRNGKKSERTKKAISLTSIEKWKNPEIVEKMVAGLKEGTRRWKEKSKNNFVIFKCSVCEKEIPVKPHILKIKKYCSIACSIKDGTYINGIINGRIAKIEKNKLLKKEIFIDILSWAKNNKDLILNCPYNKIVSTFKPLLVIIEQKYNIIDIRSLFSCFNVKSKKEFLKYLKDYIIKENIC